RVRRASRRTSGPRNSSVSSFRDFVRVLVADDQPGIRKRVCLTLAARMPLEVCEEASNGAEAVEMVQEVNPDVVILDITMPVMNGLEAARKIGAIYHKT